MAGNGGPWRLRYVQLAPVSKPRLLTRVKHGSGTGQNDDFLRGWLRYVHMEPYRNPAFYNGRTAVQQRWKPMISAWMASPGGALLCAHGTVSKPRISCSKNTAQIQQRWKPMIFLRGRK